MSHEKRVNGVTVTQEEWEALYRTFEETGNPIGEIFNDDEVTAEEINDFLDFNQDGKVSLTDLTQFSKSYTAGQFEGLKNSLKKYGYDLAHNVSDPKEFEEKRKTLPDYVKKDLHIVSKLLHKDNSVLIYLDEDLRKDRNLILEALKLNPGILLTAIICNPELKNDREFILEAVQKNGLALCWAKNFLNDREIVMAAVSQNGSALRNASDELKNDKTVVMASVRQNGDAIYYASPVLKEDPEVVLAAQENFNLFRTHWKGDLKAWRSKIVELHQRGIRFPADMERSVEFFCEGLKKRLGIFFPERFRSFESIYEIFKNRLSPNPHDHRPVALIFSAISDHNGALRQYPLTDSFVKSEKFKVFYFEVGHDSEVQEILKRITENGANTVHTLAFLAHGYISGFQLADNPNEEKAFIDLNDFRLRGEFMDLKNYLQPNGQILLAGCYNGFGGENERDNFANEIKRHVPSGVRIYSSQEATNFHKIEISGDLSLNVERKFDRPYNTVAMGAD